jgi:hypothetical protein
VKPDGYDGKNYNQRDIYLCGFAERLKKAGRVVRHVFHRDGLPICTFRRSWRTACRAAGVPGRSRILHDFRRTAVRNLERAGVPRSAAMALVGHKTESIYRRYAIVDVGVLRESAAKIDRGAGTLFDVMGTVSGTTTAITTIDALLNQPELEITRDSK